MLRGRPPKERWRPVVGYESEYEVSDHGQVRSLPRTVPDARTGIRRLPGRLLSQIPMNNGYVAVGLCRRGRVKLAKVHRLVLEAFVGPCPEGCETRHYPDRDKTNNKLVNLSWSSHSQNAKDRVPQGSTVPLRGEDHPGSKLTEKKVQKIRSLYKTGKYTQKEVAEMVGGIRQSTVSIIVTRRIWGHVT